MWFTKRDLTFHPIIVDPNIRGYVLPHAGTKHTGKIISHTLRFKPKFKFTKVVILYYPVSDKPNVQGKFYHEYYVPMKSIKYFIEHRWNMKKIRYIGINVKDTKINTPDISNTLVIVSADFSHYLPLQQAISLENKAAHSMMYQNFFRTKYNSIIDNVISFKYLKHITPSDWYLQWIGRSRSLGERGVGYLSFLIKQENKLDSPDGIFVTCYDNDMNARECLGEWFFKRNWTQSIENNLVKKVILEGTQTSRLTGGQNKHIPINYYSITYLYEDKRNMIRGYHGVKTNAFYLPEVLLEHTYPNGTWIQKEDQEWKEGRFQIKETIQKLGVKAGVHSNSQTYTLYRSEVRHYKIKH